MSEMSDMWGAVIPSGYGAPTVDGLTDKEQDYVRRLTTVWMNKLSRNQRRKKYYRAKNGLKDLNISIPPQLKGVETALGWAAKAVDMLAVRSRFDGYVMNGDGESQIDEILRQNNFVTMYHQAVTSELIHSCSFITVSKGDEGEPDVVISAYSAENAAAIWEPRKKRIECGMTIVDVDDDTRLPKQINLYTDDAIIEMYNWGSSKWACNRLPHAQGRPLMEPLVYRPSLDRPMGKSRISRSVMSITDSAVRTNLRSEVSAEFFTSPQKYLLGVDDNIFADSSKWEAYIGNLFAISKDEDGDVPQFGQLSQMSMQPHTDYLRSLAAQFAGETNIPISSLGVIHDNPASAEAIYAAKEDLIIEAESLNETNGNALRNIGLLVLAILQNKTVAELTDDEKSIMPIFRNPAIPSIVSQADAMVKIAAAASWVVDTDVFLEEIGFNESQRMRLNSAKRKMQAQQTLNSMMAQEQFKPKQEKQEEDSEQEPQGEENANIGE